MPRLTVLIVAHQGPLQMALVDSLQQVGCRVGTASNEELGVQQASELRPDVVLLEHPLPDGDSLKACRRIRDVFSTQDQPVFLMTPSGSDAVTNGRENGRMLRDRVAALDRLAHGVNTLVNWTRTSQARANQIDCESLTIDNLSHRATIEDCELLLTPTEFRLLWTLALQPGHVLSRKQLSDACRGAGDHIQHRTIDVHIKAIRRKLKGHANIFETVRGLGYRLRESKTS